MVRFLKDVDDVTFIQLGANNGRTVDPIREYVKKHGWKGVFVEPVEKPRRKLRKLYRHSKGLHFDETVVMQYDGVADFYEAYKYDVVSTAKMANWKIYDAYEKGDVIVSSRPCMTVESLRRKYDIGQYDLLQMDIEGSEYDVIKTLKVWPTVIHYEEKHLGDEKLECRDFLKSKGYKLILEKTEDVLAWIPS